MLVTYKGFEIDIPYDIQEIKYIPLKEEVNEHTKLQLKCVVEADKILEYINKLVEGEKVVVSEYIKNELRTEEENTDEDTKKLIFQGKIIKVDIEYHGQLHLLELKCISFTHDFDIEKKKRTFCNLDLTYKKDTRRNADLVKYYYTVMGGERFLTVLNHYANGEGYGIENIWCVFADDYETWEDDYFGDTGIAYYFDYPAVEKDETVILDYETFFKYLKEACIEYLERNPENKKEVEGYLTEIKERFNIVD